MDQIKIGKFIAERRRKEGLTQKQLAERLHLTDKTVSKWETGCRLPDASLLPALSSILKADINELLAGEEFLSQAVSSEEYAEKAERNLLGLVNELNVLDQKSRGKIIGAMAGLLLTGAACLYLFAFSSRMGKIGDMFDFPTLLYLLGLKFTILAACGWFHDYLNGWRAIFPKSALFTNEREWAIQALAFAGTLTVAIGGLIALLGLFSLLNYMEQPVSLGASLAQIVLTLLYTAIGKTIYVILTWKIKRTLR